MKKLLVVSIMALGLGTAALANEGTNSNRGTHRTHSRLTHKKHSNCRGTNSKERELMREAVKNNPKFEQWQIELQENKVKLMKAMANDTPNFTEIGEINKERAIIQAEIKTERMVIKHNIDKELEKTQSN